MAGSMGKYKMGKDGLLRRPTSINVRRSFFVTDDDRTNYIATWFTPTAILPSMVRDLFH